MLCVRVRLRVLATLGPVSAVTRRGELFLTFATNDVAIVSHPSLRPPWVARPMVSCEGCLRCLLLSFFSG